MNRTNLIVLGFISCLAIYLFATAPAELREDTQTGSKGEEIEVQRMFTAMNAINDSARNIYTSKIVGGGKKAGLAFGEDWDEPSVEKGPLPALFLRLVAARMETKPPQLGLYLGSDEPINKSNLFSGMQASAYETVRDKKETIFMEDDKAGFVAMFPDVASAQPCVTCHNDHDDSPKTDWKLGDVMGATTWTYPKKMVQKAEYVDVTEALYSAVAEAYTIYLDKAGQFSKPVPNGETWPDKSLRRLPDTATFMTEVRNASAPIVISALLFDTTEKFVSLGLEPDK